MVALGEIDEMRALRELMISEFLDIVVLKGVVAFWRRGRIGRIF